VLGAVGWHTQSNLTAAQIYTVSALRIVPYLPLVVGPLAIVAGIMVDVILYATAHPAISTASVLQARFRLAFEYASALHEGPIVVAAHSQGTVIAVDALGQQPAGSDRAVLITAGSPLASLYGRFLGSTPETRAPRGAFRQPLVWQNFSRTGDYIGASQFRADVHEHDLGPGGHTGYWKVPALWTTVLSTVEAGRDEPDGRSR
jgi:pimeloyl-ACP methyl ester carboxylesterase